MKKIAVITMVRNDLFFLEKWVDYYSRQFGAENLYIFFDGKDQEVPEFCRGCNCTVVDKIGTNVVNSDKGRIRFVSQQAKRLFEQGYEIVIGGDADEYLVVDPAEGKTLAEYLSDSKLPKTISGLGLDFGQRLGEETDLKLTDPFLSQRRYARIGTRYTKATVLTTPLEWGSGFHRVEGRNFHIDPHLYLLHFGYSDLRMIQGRIRDNDRLKQGWKHHIEKRRKTIDYVTMLEPRDFDRTTKMARKIERLVRPPYAWNKPGLLGLKLTVKLPERFENVL
ncbi:MAG: glycosyltransferase family 2 protein [Muribaculaceae bacterium]|nr:glycosyltransferase family 2 protein [Muribaculaceae bacterium]